MGTRISSIRLLEGPVSGRLSLAGFFVADFGAVGVVPRDHAGGGGVTYAAGLSDCTKDVVFGGGLGDPVPMT